MWRAWRVCLLRKKRKKQLEEKSKGQCECVIKPQECCCENYSDERPRLGVQSSTNKKYRDGNEKPRRALRGETEETRNKAGKPVGNSENSTVYSGCKCGVSKLSRDCIWVRQLGKLEIKQYFIAFYEKWKLRRVSKYLPQSRLNEHGGRSCVCLLKMRNHVSRNWNN